MTTPRTIATVECSAIFVSLELSRSTWLVTALAAPVGSRLSKHQVQGGDMPGLLARFSDLQRNVHHRTGQLAPVIVIQEAGLDGFWIHRALVAEGIESHVVDPASIAVSRRHRRAKTDKIDGEALVRTLMAWKRGEPRVCSMVRAPTPEEEDRRRVCRELKTLIGERIRHVNRLKGLFFSQGIGGYEPRNKDRRERLEDLRTGNGRPLPKHLKALALRELDIIELLNRQIETVKIERDALLEEARADGCAPEPVRMLLGLKGIGPGFAGALWSEGLFRQFANRRQVAAYAGLAPTPWNSGKINHEQGVSKAGNPRLRAIAVEMAWLWLRHQPDTALARWYHQRVRRFGPRTRKVTIVALARKLLVALWKYVNAGVVIEGARMKAA
ncbi:IS110 family transposase [Ruegeria sp. HKCCD8929]|uniref:IS110 family transposase n=1 Tax=Ruegeria sp. HKCCD8929 TaxID=2683006 RepID=UPI00148940B2|nr:IS110 family transposase [Ruegeria sp. HKCCD8929]